MAGVYTFIKRTDTEEIHIFDGSWSATAGYCDVNFSCICNKMKRNQGAVIIACLEEDEARTNAATLGRDVCGVCVSHLYETY